MIKMFKKLFTLLMVTAFLLTALSAFSVEIKAESDFRREISTEAPAWIVHIDTWVTPDPQAIIDIIPEEIRPFVIFNLSFSVNGYNAEEGWGIVEYAYETAKSWLTVCAENGVWATVQGASGSPCHFPDLKEMKEYEDTLYREFFEQFPNFLGFNYSEQFWGWGEWTSVEDRYNHLANLLEITNEYGGYLFVSWCSNKWVNDQNPNALIELYPKWAEAVDKYSDNYVLFTKYTSHSYIEDMESQVFGNWLSEYCGNWGIRYDETGWTGEKDFLDDYTMSTGLAVMLEGLLLNGATVIDGPELVFKDDFNEVKETTDQDGWTNRNWESLTVFKNVVQDLIYKILDGTITIPTREEVLARTKVYILDDVTSGKIDEKHSTPNSLTEGLYRMDGDGYLNDNNNFYKKTGRYVTVPQIYRVTDAIAQSDAIVVKKSEYNKRWKTVEAKVEEFNNLYPEMYTGDIYLSNYQNCWVAYNPYKSNKLTASGTAKLLYNTCDSMNLELSRYASAVISEYTDRLEIYLNNYDDNNLLEQRKNIFSISGCSSQPVYTLTDRGVNQKATVHSSVYENGVFILTVESNGPVDIVINCSGSSAKNTTPAEKSVLSAPVSPEIYTGYLRYEAELFSYKNTVVTKNGARGLVDNYAGQGYADLKDKGQIKETVSVPSDGEYVLSVKYSSDKTPSDIALYVNGSKAATFVLSSTGGVSKWNTASASANLKAGENEIELRTISKSSSSLYVDHLLISNDLTSVDGKNSSPVVLNDSFRLIAGAVLAVAAVIIVVIVVIKKKEA